MSKYEVWRMYRIKAASLTKVPFWTLGVGGIGTWGTCVSISSFTASSLLGHATFRSALNDHTQIDLRSLGTDLPNGLGSAWWQGE